MNTTKHRGRCAVEQPEVGPQGESRLWDKSRKTAVRQLRRRSGLGKPANQMSGSERVKCQDIHGWAEKRKAMRGQAKGGCVVKKHPQARLRVSFIKQIWHSRSESTRCFLSFLSVYILVIRGLKFLAAKRRENAKNDGLTVVKTFYTFHTCLQQQL
jgi:hypothetical protein